uniref:Alkaline phosphatase n=2 Tax=Clastoptera arizonana TaxID=38151 RepID=A0A1B6CV61_9HEMI
MFPYQTAVILVITGLLQDIASLPRPSSTKNKEESDPNFWLKKARFSLDDHIDRKPITNKAKNVIMFLGDGMSMPTVTASRIYKGQLGGEMGEEGALSFDYFPWTGISKTYCVNSQVADSACSATALLTGVKINRGTLGVAPNVKQGDCRAMRNETNHLESILTWAQKANKRTGIVTTTRITHASPAGTYAHTASRDWEGDIDVLKDKQDPGLCEDIASQLVNRNPGQKINVALGGGRRRFLPEQFEDSDQGKGSRKDSKDLIKSWIKDKEVKNLTHRYVWNRNGLLSIDVKATDYVLGLFASEHMPYALDSAKSQYPSLQEMTKVAIQILSKGNDGFFLFVEGGRIDHAHHGNLARNALQETLEFSNAIQQAVDMTCEDDTLIVVTADHAHTMSLSGYPARGHDILGIGGKSSVDHLPYTTVSYANGPSYEIMTNGSRKEIHKSDLEKKHYKYPSLFPMTSETHGGDDVAIYASGCWAHLFSGVVEQNVIPLLMGYASCLGPQRTFCSDVATCCY